MSELINKVVTKHEIRGEVQITKVYPELENLTVTPTKELQSFNHPDSYGYNNVMVKAIDCEPLSVVPQKENQVFDGMYDKVNVRAIDCETLNITPKQEEQSFNGMYDKVNVDAIVGDTLEIAPKNTEQSFKGLYEQVNVAAIQADTLNVTPKKESQTFNGLYATVNVEEMHGDTISITPMETTQTYKGIYENINVDKINIEEVSIDPDFSSQDTIEVTATEGKYIKKITVNKDENLVAENIMEGEVVCGIEGTGRNGIDTSDATATAEDIAKDKTAYVNGEKVVGTHEASGGDYNAKIEGLTKGTTVKPGFCDYLTEISITETLSGNLEYAFYNKTGNLRKVELSDTSGVTSMLNTFNACTKLEELSPLDLSNNENMTNSFYNCSSIKELTLLNTNKVTSMYNAFYATKNLKTLSALNCDSVNNIKLALENCAVLENFGGCINLGKNYASITDNNVDGNGTLNIQYSQKLSHQSLMNIINGLYDLNLTYDVANGGRLYSQHFKLGNTNKSKLTAEEIAIATSKGWTVS